MKSQKRRIARAAKPASRGEVGPPGPGDDPDRKPEPLSGRPARSDSNIDVLIVRWPEDAPDIGRLAAARRPRLLLVAPDADPPENTDCEADWVRLPADDRDVAARLRALSSRAARHYGTPLLDDQGRLIHRGRWVSLSPIERRLAELLVEHFEAVVSSDELTRSAWPGEKPSSNALRVHLTRLRRRIEPLGLEIRGVRSEGHVLQERLSPA